DNTKPSDKKKKKTQNPKPKSSIDRFPFRFLEIASTSSSTQLIFTRIQSELVVITNITLVHLRFIVDHIASSKWRTCSQSLTIK
ncbi:unnamed protein product, partial [Arabidopsis halleri]